MQSRKYFVLVPQNCEKGANIFSWGLEGWAGPRPPLPHHPPTHPPTHPQGKTRSSAQGNCSAKSLVSNVIDSSLSSSSLSSGGGGPGAGGSGGGRVQARGGGWGGGGRSGGRGQGTFHPPCHTHCTTTWCFALKGLRTMNTASRCTYLARAGRFGDGEAVAVPAPVGVGAAVHASSPDGADALWARRRLAVDPVHAVTRLTPVLVGVELTLGAGATSEHRARLSCGRKW